MQKLRLMLFCLIVILCAGSLKAEMTVRQYQENMQSETTRQRTTDYINGLGKAYSFVNIRLGEEKETTALLSPAKPSPKRRQLHPNPK